MNLVHQKLHLIQFNHNIASYYIVTYRHFPIQIQLNDIKKYQYKYNI